MGGEVDSFRPSGHTFTLPENIDLNLLILMNSSGMVYHYPLITLGKPKGK